MNLVIDIGNSRTKLAVFNAQDLMFNVPLDQLEAPHLRMLKEEHPQLSKAILSTVRDYPAEVKKFLQENFEQFIELDASTKIPLNNRYKTPETLGKDRIAAAVGAQELFPGHNILVIDAGTAITFDMVTENSEYLGGNISPGLATRFRALNEFTGKLPLVSANDEFELIGTDTESAIRAGVQMGVLYEVEQYMANFNSLYRNLKIIITGGDAKFFDKKLKNSIFVHFNLTLIGLNRILEYNAT